MYFTSSRRHMGKHVNGKLLFAFGWLATIIITVLDIYGLWNTFAGG
jgi:Mn2+/Fe2+ NRAMP family transporter